jgi:hypothetical protein
MNVQANDLVGVGTIASPLLDGTPGSVSASASASNWLTNTTSPFSANASVSVKHDSGTPPFSGLDSASASASFSYYRFFDVTVPALVRFTNIYEGHVGGEGRFDADGGARLTGPGVDIYLTGDYVLPAGSYEFTANVSAYSSIPAGWAQNTSQQCSAFAYLIASVDYEGDRGSGTPEPTAIVIWSLLGVLAITARSWRQNRTA